MPDWNARISSTSYRFVRVSRATGEETEVIPFLKRGAITRNNDVRIMETAEADLVGDLDIGPDLVRVYMVARWPGGDEASVPLGTFLPMLPSRNVRRGYSTASVKMYGRLQELMDDKFAAPYVVQPGTNAVELAASVAEGIGLTVVADESGYKTTETRSYGVGASTANSETGDSKLDMVNDLLSLAGFRAAKTDPMGRVLMKRYVEPLDQPPIWTFAEGLNAKFEWDMTDEFDYTEAANHVVVRYDSEDGTVAAEAWDDDPESPLSTVSRGRTITRSYSYTSLPPGDDDAGRREYARQRAATLLRTAQATIRRVTATHAYAPVTVNDTVTVEYPGGGVEGSFEIRVQKLTLSGGCPTETELRQFRR